MRGGSRSGGIERRSASMLTQAGRGLLAGAAGTVALNVATYMDMAVRARPSSAVPAKVAASLAEGAGIDLAAERHHHAPLTRPRAPRSQQLIQDHQHGRGRAVAMLTQHAPRERHLLVGEL